MTYSIRNWSRVELWRYFEPRAGGGDPRYADVANRLQVLLERHRPKYDLTGALQYVQFGGLPTRATGPGPLGTGSLYFDHAGRTDSRQVYLRYLNLRLKSLAPGWSVQVGRMGYTSGAESPSGDAALEAVKRQRLDARLIGEFDWSLYQRGFDGVRTDLDRPRWHVSGAALRPTQGGFEDAAGAEIRQIDVFAASLTAKPGLLSPHTDWQGFVVQYTDHRPVRARPDNSGQLASRVDARITSAGAAGVGAYPLDAGHTLDAVGWLVVQRGRWFEQTHNAWGGAAEAGVRWTAVRWRPWLRGGVNYASGDANPSDGTHGTFFPVLPTARKYSLSATYTSMNLNDLFAQFTATPRPPLSVRVEIHKLALAHAADRWYFGSGAGQSSGTIFGYGARPSQGSTDFGTAIEGAADYRINPHWSVNGYLGTVRGGHVVTRTFAGRTLVFGYLENVLQF